MRPVLCFCLLLCCLSCHKGDSTPPEPCGAFAGIVLRDLNGQAFGPPDSDDWGWKEDWCAEAEALFADRPPVVIDTLPPDSFLTVAYPNPASDLCFLGFFRDDPSYVEFRIVDAQFQTLYSRDSLTGTAFAVDMGPLPGPRPQLVRVYYRMVYADGTAHRGHGDVQLTD